MKVITTERAVIAIARAVLSTGGVGRTAGVGARGIVFLIFVWAKRRGWVT